MNAGSEGDHPRAVAHDEVALRCFRTPGREDRIGAVINNLGLAAYYQRDYERAAALHEEALAARRAVGDQGGVAMSLANLGLVAYSRGDYDRAATLQEEALALSRTLSRKISLAHGFENLALIAAARQDPARAVRLFAAAEALRVRIGAPSQPEDRDFNQGLIDEARATLGEAAFTAAWDEGGAMPLDAAIDYALGET